LPISKVLRRFITKVARPFINELSSSSLALIRTGNIVINAGNKVTDKTKANNPAYLAKVEQFKHWLVQQPEVVHVNSIIDTFKRLNKNMHGDQPQWYALPEQRDLAAQYLLLYEMSLPYGLDLNDQINIDKSGIRVIASMENLSTKQMLDIERRLHDWMAVNFSEYTINAASPVLMFSNCHLKNRSHDETQYFHQNILQTHR
jgi:predicted RND superfamily exporter protein